MATTKNTNLFYQLYSTKNDITSSPYICSNTVDDSKTSFDISGSEAQITDSNGDILSSLSLGNIHVDEISEYNIETKILQPYSTYLLQGNELGEAHRTLYFRIPENIQNISGYENYCNMGFDIAYQQNGKSYNLHILTKNIRETYGSVISLVQSQLNKLKLPITISIKQIEDENRSDNVIDYIEFMSTEEGYDFIVRNVILYPILPGDTLADGTDGDFYDSPFYPAELTTDVILDMLETVKPSLNGSVSDDNYTVDCGLYKTLLQFADIITDDFNTFCYELDIIKKYFLSCYDEYGALIFPKQLEVLKEQYPEIAQKFYDDELVKYNILDLVKIFDMFKTYIFDAKAATGPNNCFEDLDKRVNNIKYPNGAMKGCVILPEWPTDEEYEYNVLLVHHVSDKIELSVPVELDQLKRHLGGNVISKHNTRLYEKCIAYVQINVLIPDEKTAYISDDENLPLNDITSNDGFSTSFDELQLPGYDTHDYILNDFHRIPLAQTKSQWVNDSDGIEYYSPEMYIDSNNDSDDIWENNPNKTNTNIVDTHQAFTQKYIGLYKYMDYLSKNDLWLRIGDSYIITGKNDNHDSSCKNLLNSAIIYNPNNIPIRIKCMIFS